MKELTLKQPATKNNRKRKFSFVELEREMHVLSKTESAEIIAGDAFPTTTTPDCFFDVIHTISNAYGGNTGQASIESAYNAQYGSSWQTSGGVSFGNAYEFASNHFSVSSPNLPQSSWQSEMANGSQIFATVSNGSGGTHAVLVTGYDSYRNEYSVFDASNNLYITGVKPSKFTNEAFAICSAYYTPGTTEYEYTTTYEHTTTEEPV